MKVSFNLWKKRTNKEKMHLEINLPKRVQRAGQWLADNVKFVMLNLTRQSRHLFSLGRVRFSWYRGTVLYWAFFVGIDQLLGKAI